MSKDLHAMSERTMVKYLREAECVCRPPKVEYKPNVGPRCAKCGTQVRMVHRGGYTYG